MNLIPSPIEYSFILIRYNEVGLKSPKVRTRMEHRLITHASKILQREEIQVIEAKRIFGRILFQIPPEEMPKAMLVFKYIIGIHSYSPVLQISKDYEEIQQKALEIAQTLFHGGEKFAVRARRIKPYPKTSIEIEHEIGGMIHQKFEDMGKPLLVDLKNPEKTIHIEVRTKNTFLYAQTYYTYWGGNPIEYDKSLFGLWNWNQKSIPNSANISIQKIDPNYFSALSLLMRRGSVITPVFCFFKEELRCQFLQNPDFEYENPRLSDLKPKIQEELNLVLKYYPIKIPVIFCNLERVYEYISNQFPLSESLQKYQTEKNEAFTKLQHSWIELLFLREIFNRNSPEAKQLKLRYEGRFLSFKGFISSIKISDYALELIAQKSGLVHLMPLAGFTDVMRANLNQMIHSISATSFPKEISPKIQFSDPELYSEQGFSIAKLIEKNLKNQTSERKLLKNSDPWPIEMVEEFLSEIIKFTEREEIQTRLAEIWDKIIEKTWFIFAKGKILA